MPKKHAHFWLHIRHSLKQLWCLIEKCRLNSLRRPAVCYRCSNVNVLFHTTITVHRDLPRQPNRLTTRLTIYQSWVRSRRCLLGKNYFVACCGLVEPEWACLWAGSCASGRPTFVVAVWRGKCLAGSQCTAKRRQAQSFTVPHTARGWLAGHCRTPRPHRCGWHR